MNNQEIDEKVSQIKSILLKSLVVVGLGLVSAAGYFAYRDHLAKQNAKAAALLYKAYSMEVLESPTPETPEALGQMKSFDAQKIIAWEPAKLEAYMKVLSELGEQYVGTPNWALGQIRRAKVAEAQKDFATAEKHFRTVVDSLTDSPVFFALATDSLAVMLEDQGQYDKALDVYRKAAVSARNPLRPLSLLGEARNLSALGKPGAEKILNKVIKDFPETTYSRRAKILLSSQMASDQTASEGAR